MFLIFLCVLTDSLFFQKDRIFRRREVTTNLFSWVQPFDRIYRSKRVVLSAVRRLDIPVFWFSVMDLSHYLVRHKKQFARHCFLYISFKLTTVNTCNTIFHGNGNLTIYQKELFVNYTPCMGTGRIHCICMCCWRIVTFRFIVIFFFTMKLVLICLLFSLSLFLHKSIKAHRTKY